MPNAQKHVVSVSLGTSKRDKREEVTFLDQPFLVERRGTDGDLERFGQTISELDGNVAAIGVGGCDIYVVTRDRKYAFQQILKLVQRAKKTPLVDGSGLKHTLERRSIEWLQASGTFDFTGKKVLLVSAVDRFGMAQSLAKTGASIVYGDLIFGVGLPIPIRSMGAVDTLAKILLPIITRLPFKWFYPTGEKQEIRTPKFAKYFEEADLICGDWHFIHKYMPARLEGKTILTQTVRKADLEFLRSAGIARVITTTPIVGGETFATNVMEALIVALLDRPVGQISERDYEAVLEKLGWQPNPIELTGMNTGV